jgi:NAD(P)-dependent dehydrogenase (short-subunit alcohol dehydrogenase family)
MNRLTGKVAVITGAGSGVGQAAVQEFGVRLLVSRL